MFKKPACASHLLAIRMPNYALPDAELQQVMPQLGEHALDKARLAADALVATLLAEDAT